MNYCVTVSFYAAILQCSRLVKRQNTCGKTFLITSICEQMNNIIIIMFILCSAISGAFIAHTGNKTKLIIQINDVNL